MTGIDELRATLEGRTHDLPQVDTATRVAGARGRAAAVRRRRRAAVAVGAVAAVAGAAGLATLPGGDGRPDQADRLVAGVSAPAELEALGYTYAFERSVEGEPSGRGPVASGVSVELEADDVPRLVTWATAGADQRVVLRDRELGPLPYEVPDFGDFVLVPAGAAETVLLFADDAQVDAAVYRLTDDAPAGVTRDGITFRQEVAGATLVDAVIGDQGAAEVELEVTTPAGKVGYAPLCTGAPERSWLEIGLGDEGGFGISCSGDDAFDPGASSFQTVGTPGPGTVRLRLTRGGVDGPLVDDPEVRLGLGLYALPPGSDRVAGQRPPVVVEEGGHSWRLRTLSSSRAGDRELVARADDTSAPLLARLLLDGKTGRAVPSVNGAERSSFESAVGTSSSGGIGLVAPGSVVRVDLRGTVGDDAQIAIAFYERAD